MNKRIWAQKTKGQFIEAGWLADSNSPGVDSGIPGDYVLTYDVNHSITFDQNSVQKLVSSLTSNGWRACVADKSLY